MSEAVGALEEQLVSEEIVPVGSSFLPQEMATGAPSLPLRFRWRECEIRVARMIESWRTTGACYSGSGERYVRRHWFWVEAADGARMRIYFERQPRSRRPTRRWWLYTRTRPPAS